MHVSTTWYVERQGKANKLTTPRRVAIVNNIMKIYSYLGIHLHVMMRMHTPVMNGDCLHLQVMQDKKIDSLMIYYTIAYNCHE